MMFRWEMMNTAMGTIIMMTPTAAPARESRLACAANGREKLKNMPAGKLAIISAVHAQRKLSSACSMLRTESPSVTAVRTGA